MTDKIEAAAGDWRRWGLVFVVLLAFVGGAAYAYYRIAANQVRESNFEAITAVGELKAFQITQWRRERLRDAAILGDNPLFRDQVARWLTQPDNAELRDAVVARLKFQAQPEEYTDVLLTAPDGALLLTSGPGWPSLHPFTRQALANAITVREAVLSDLHRSEQGVVSLDAVAPVVGDEGEPLAAVVLRTNANTHLFPLVQFWPTPSDSAETLLLRQDGDHVLLLNELRHHEGAALSLRIPVSRTDNPAAQAAQGQTGLFSGRDYRGASVLADLRPVPETSWFMVSKIDEAEILAAARYPALVIGLNAALFIALTGGGIAYHTRRQQAGLYRSLWDAERARSQAHEEFRTTLYSIGDGLIVAGADGRLRHMNPVAEYLTGWTEGEARGRPVEEVFVVVNEDTRNMVENPVARVLCEGQIIGLTNHTVLIAREGTERPIADSGAPIRDEDGKIMGVVLVFRDQSEQRIIESALRESEALLSRAQSVAQIGSWSLDLERNLFTCSSESYRMFGWTPGKEMTRQRFLSSVHSDDAAYVDHCWQASLDGAPYDVEYRIIVNGEAKWIRERIQFEGDGDSLAGRAVGTMQDVTERKEAELRTRRLNAELEERVTQRTAELTAANQELEAFTYAVSHDLRAPVRALSGFSLALLEDYRDALPKEGRVFLDQILAAGQQMGALIEGLLTLSRSTRGELRRDVVDFSALSECICRQLADAEPERAVSWRVEPGIMVRGDARMLEVVMRNLLANAWKYTSGRPDAEVRVYSRRIEGKPFCCVADNGAGFDMRHAGNLFKPFQRLHRADEFPGIGIGLATVHRIVARHGGRITAMGAVNEGATFCFTLSLTHNAQGELP